MSIRSVIIIEMRIINRQLVGICHEKLTKINIEIWVYVYIHRKQCARGVKQQCYLFFTPHSLVSELCACQMNEKVCGFCYENYSMLIFICTNQLELMVCWLCLDLFKHERKIDRNLSVCVLYIYLYICPETFDVRFSYSDVCV